MQQSSKVNKRTLIALYGILLSIVFLSAIIISLKNTKEIFAKSEEMDRALLAQNNQPLPPIENRLVKDKEIEQIIGLLDLSRTAHRMISDNINNPYMKELSTYLNGENPRQFAGDIKIKTEIINRLLANDIMNNSVEQAIQRIALFHNNLQLMRPPVSIILRGEKIALFQRIQTQFLDLGYALLTIKDQLDSQVLKKLSVMYAVSPNPELNQAIDNVNNAIAMTQTIRDSLSDRLNPYMNGYLNTLSSMPEQTMPTGLEGDVNADSKVDIFDLVTVAKNFGKKMQ